MLTPVLLNFFDDAYNVCVRGIPAYWRALIAIVSLVLCLFYLYKTIKKSNDKHPVNWGYVMLMIVFCAITILYSMA